MPALNPPPALTVNPGERGYPVYVVPRVLEGLGALVEAHMPYATSCVDITCETVGRLYGGATAESICRLRPRLLTVPDGVERMLGDVIRLCVKAEEAAA